MPTPFKNRITAGRALAMELAEYTSHPDLLVLGLPRGGVPVADQVARALHAELDVIVVRKIGAPGHPELALGAVASGGLFVSNAEFADVIGDSAAIRKITDRERRTVTERERLYRCGRPAARIKDREVILVDDGAATGASMLVAIRALRKLGASRIVVALPVASQSALRKLVPEADAVVCASAPPAFQAVGDWYQDFSATSDSEVCELLKTDSSPGITRSGAAPSDR